MQIAEYMSPSVTGHIRAVWTEKATGREVAVACDKSNVILYTAADIIARLVSGDTEVVPGFVGYVYAPLANSVPNPASDPAPRHYDWSDILGNITPLTVGGDMVISPITTTPRITASSASYASNTVTFSAMSDSNAAPVVTPGGAGPHTSDKYFQVVLLARVFSGGVATYIPFAYTQLAAGDGGIAVLADMELTVYWTISFK
jgi:hypothetical protein